MKILLINWCDRKNPLGGGAEVHLEEIFSRISRMGNEVYLLCSNFEGAKKAETADGIEVIRTGRRATFNFDARDYYLKNLRHENFDIVVEDINKIPFYTPLWVRPPVLPVIPHLFGTTVFREAPFPLALYVYLWEKPLLKFYRNLQMEVISESTKTDLVERGFEKDRIHVIHCGIDRCVYSPGGEKSPTPLLVYVGRVKKYKRVDLPLKALKELKRDFPGIKLVVVGDGDALPGLKKTASRLLKPEDYEFKGFVPIEEKVYWMRRANIVVNTSEKEGWGLTGVEANACGTAVVASDSPGIKDSIKNGISGVLVRHGDLKDLTETISKLLKDDEYRKKIETGAIQRVKDLTWENAAEKTFQLMEDILK